MNKSRNLPLFALFCSKQFCSKCKSGRYVLSVNIAPWLLLLNIITQRPAQINNRIFAVFTTLSGIFLVSMANPRHILTFLFPNIIININILIRGVYQMATWITHTIIGFLDTATDLVIQAILTHKNEITKSYEKIL